MNNRHLEYFVKVYETGSLQSAAEDIGVTQPTISAAIRKLEEDLQASLFDRMPRGVRPTIYGKSFYETARLVTNNLQSAKKKIRELQDPSQGDLTFGLSREVSRLLIGRIGGKLSVLYPGMTIRPIIGSYTFFVDQLLTGKLELALAQQPNDQEPSEINAELLYNDRLCPFVNPKNPLAKISSITPERFLESEIAEIETTEFANDEWNALLESKNLKPRRATLGGNDVGFIKNALVARPELAAFLPYNSVRDELAQGNIKEIKLKGYKAPRKVSLLSLKNRQLSPAASIFREGLLHWAKNCRRDQNQAWSDLANGL